MLHLLDIKDFNDWYKVTLNELKQMGGGGLLAHYGSLSRLLTTVYPEYLKNLTELHFLISVEGCCV